jgi:hypothetical protein
MLILHSSFCFVAIVLHCFLSLLFRLFSPLSLWVSACVCDQSLLDISSSLILVLPSSSSCRAVETLSVPAGLPAPADPTASKFNRSRRYLLPPPPAFSFLCNWFCNIFSCFLLSDVFSSGSRVACSAFTEGLASSLPTGRFP